MAASDQGRSTTRITPHPLSECFFFWALVTMALAEDLSQGDVTTEAIIPPDLEGKASILFKAPGMLAGMGVAKTGFRHVDPTLRFEELLPDGASVQHGSIVATVEGKAAGVLQAERVALNFLQHLSGIATTTARYVEAIAGTRARKVRVMAPPVTISPFLLKTSAILPENV